LEGGPNSSGPWTPIATGDWNFLTRQESRIWPVTNHIAFPSFRFSFPTNNSSTLAAYVGDLRLLEFRPCTPAYVADIEKITSDQVRLTFTAPAASNYVAQFTTDFLTWNDFTTNAVPQDGTWMTIDASATNEARFYRLRQ
jgi:hypothetical protein